VSFAGKANVENLTGTGAANLTLTAAVPARQLLQILAAIR